MSTVTQSDRAWSSESFRRLWTASAVSSFGSEVAEIAMPLLALVTLSATAAEVSVLRVAQFLPFLLATLPLGLLVDRWSGQRLRLMVTADLGRFVLVALIPITVWVGVARIEMLYGVVFAVGVLTVLYQIADFAFLPSVVRPDQLVDANGKIAAAQSANEIGGRGLGGLLVQAVSAPAAVAVNAAAFLGSALSLRRIRLAGPDGDDASTDGRDEGGPEGAGGSVRLSGASGGGVAASRDPDSDTASRQSPGREVMAGIRVAVRDRYVRALLGEATTFNVFNELFILGLMLYAVRDRSLGAAAIGLVFTAGGAGSFVGAWFGARVTGRFGYGRVLLVTLLVGNAAPLGVLLADASGDALLALLCGVFVVMGVGIGVANVHAVSLRQSAVDPALRGRVNAAYRLISWGAIPLGAGVGGLLATKYGAETTMITGAAGVALATLWVAFSAVPRLRTIDDARSWT